MRGKRNVDTRAAEKLDSLLGDRGWTAYDVHQSSQRDGIGHPMRTVSVRSVYRVLRDGHIPTKPVQFEIAATLGLLPSHIWGDRPLPEQQTAAVAEAAA